MSTTSTAIPAPLPTPTPTPTPTPATPVLASWVHHWIALIKAHEKLLIIGILAFTAFHFYSKAIDAWDRHDSKTAQQAAVVVKADNVKTKDDSAQLAALQKTVAAQQTLIAQQIVQRKKETQTHQQADATLPLTDVGARLVEIAKLAPTDVDAATVPGSLVVSEQGSRAITEQLEVIPEFEANNAALETELTSEQTIISKQATVIADLNTELIDEKKSHVANVAAQKVKTKHAFLRGLKIGLGIGFVAGIFAGHAAGY